MDKKYWKEYYKLQHNATEASLFARFVLANYIKEKKSLLELGCGNGRDSIFFARNGVHTIGIDQCENEVSLLKAENNLPNLKFICGDFTKLSAIDPMDHIYSRFTLHSVSEKEESDTIKWVHENLKKDGKFLIEARGKQNELYKLGNPVPREPDSYIYEGHYRRFIDINKLSKKLSLAGFGIILAEENSGFAPFGDTNYKFIRVIASKN